MEVSWQSLMQYPYRLARVASLVVYESDRLRSPLVVPGLFHSSNSAARQWTFADTPQPLRQAFTAAYPMEYAA